MRRPPTPVASMSPTPMVTPSMKSTPAQRTTRTPNVPTRTGGCRIAGRGLRSSVLEKTETLVEQFHRDGYLVIPDALAPDQVERVRAGVERAFETWDAEAE